MRSLRQMRSKKRPRWPIDPENVDYGSIVLGVDQGVFVRYVGESTARIMSITEFTRKTGFQLEKHRRLRIAHLRISPRTKRRYSAFFDTLTDWKLAAQTALDRSKSSTPHRGLDGDVTKEALDVESGS